MGNKTNEKIVLYDICRDLRKVCKEKCLWGKKMIYGGFTSLEEFWCLFVVALVDLVKLGLVLLGAEGADHLGFHDVHALANDYKRVQGLTKVLIQQLGHGARDEQLGGGAQTHTSNGQGLGSVGVLATALFNLQHLLHTAVDGHEAWGLVDQATAGHVLQRLLLDLDVEEDQGVQSNVSVLLDTGVPRVGSPGLGEPDHGDGLAKVVQLQATGTDGVHDGGVVDGLDGDVELLGADDEIGVGGGAKGIADDEEGDVDVLGVVQDGV